MLSGFRQFILRGNVIDLAVGVIIGAAFGAIVASLTADVINPILASIFGKPDLSYIKIGESIMLGKFLNSIINFLITAVGLYLLIVLPFNKMMEKYAEQPPPAPPAPPTPTEVLLTEIRDLLKR